MKRLISLGLALIFLLSASICFAQKLSTWEKGVFRDIAERWHDLLYLNDNDWYAKKEDFDKIYQDVARKYNISVETVQDIDDRGIFDEDIHNQAYEIYEELGEKLRALPDWATVQDAKRVHREVAYKYGISLYELHEIEYLMEEGWYW